VSFWHYPFSALVGQDELRVSLEANAVNPAIGGVLIRGEKGTAKSTAVRSLARLLPEIEVVTDCPYSCDPASPSSVCPAGPHPPDAATHTRPVRLVELPVGASAERLTGSLDLERALTDGVRAFEPGLLAAAHRGVLYVDEVNLLSDHLVDCLLDASALGVNYVEREGVSVSHPARFLLVGTMNPDEGELRPQLLDRFGLSVEVKGSRDPTERAEIVRRHLAYESDPQAFAHSHRTQDLAVTRRIETARSNLGSISLKDGAVERIARACAELDIEGLRADIVTAKTAAALAALDRTESVTDDHIRQAAALALAHRQKSSSLDSEFDQQKLDRALQSDDETPPDGDDPEPNGPSKADSADSHPGQNPKSPYTPSSPDSEPTSPQRAQQTDSYTSGQAETNEPPGSSLPSPLLRLRSQAGGVSGRRGRLKGAQTGTAVTDTPYHGTDLALFPTLRNAALRSNKGIGQKLAVKACDLRSQVREGREGNLVVFVLDASGSMAAHKRMRKVKAAMVSLLFDAYQRRDKVGLVGFRQNTAEVIVPPTSSPQLAINRLHQLQTGGRTPLAEGLTTANRLLTSEAIREPKRRSLVILVTDGRANQGASDPLAEARLALASLARQQTGLVVLDTEQGRIRLGLAAQLAKTVGAPILHLDTLEAYDITKIIEVNAPARRAA
jgi:magnesium chelatase subunit D